MNKPRIQDVPRKSTGVYLITCHGNGRVYVGSAANCFRHRWSVHKNTATKSQHANRIFQRNWNKYGAELFSFKVIEFCSRDDCIAREQYWIEYYDAANPKNGMNIAPIAGSSIGVKRTPEMVAAHSERMKIKFGAPEYRNAAAERTKKQYSSQAARAAQSARIKLTHRTPEFRAAAAERAKERFGSPDARAAMSARAKIIHGTKEAREANAARARLQFSSPEARQAMSERGKKRFSTPESRAEASDKAKLWMLKESPEKKAARYAKVAATFAQKKAARLLTLLPSNDD
jgi:group I intron endonuclease